MGATVLVVGAGRFGAHYVRILAGMNRDRPAGAPPIDRLVVTRTGEKPAADLADQVRMDPACAVSKVAGVSVADGRGLASVLERFDPDLTCITATDPATGDAIHADYSEIVLRRSRSRLLCEKPLCPASGNGESLSAARRLKNTGAGDRFGLELPMAVVRRQMEAHPEFERRLKAASRLDFLWCTTSPLRSDLVNALALHPWSLIPERLRPDRIESRCAAGRCGITGRLRDRESGARVALKIALCNSGNERTVAIDRSLFHIDSRGKTVSILAGAADSHSASADARLIIENPLKQNIVASLAGAPVTGLDQTLQAQRFLELTRGWKGV